MESEKRNLLAQFVAHACVLPERKQESCADDPNKQPDEQNTEQRRQNYKHSPRVATILTASLLSRSPSPWQRVLSRLRVSVLVSFACGTIARTFVACHV